jgi:hypothetical protein
LAQFIVEHERVALAKIAKHLADLLFRRCYRFLRCIRGRDPGLIQRCLGECLPLGASGAFGATSARLQASQKSLPTYCPADTGTPAPANASTKA